MTATVHPINPVSAVKLRTPYSSLVPPLSDEARQALAVDILENGQRDDIKVDELGNILDGHHRHAILGDKVRCRVIHGLSEAEKKAFVVRAANAQRVMTPSQRRDFLASIKPLAIELRNEDPRKNTQQRIADKFGVDRSTVAKWFADAIVTNHNGGTPDARAKHPPEVRSEAARRVKAGESTTSVARELGIPRTTIQKIVQRAAEHPEPEPLPVAPEVVTEEVPKRRHGGGPPRIDHAARQESVLELHNQGLGTAEIADKLNLHSSLVSKVKVDLGIAATSEQVKLSADIERAVATLEGWSCAAEALVGRVESTQCSFDEVEVKRCIKSLSESLRTANQLRRALKRKQAK